MRRQTAEGKYGRARCVRALPPRLWHTGSERAVRRARHVGSRARLLPAHHHSSMHGHRVQRDHHAQPPRPHEPGGRGAGGAPVLPAR